MKRAEMKRPISGFIYLVYIALSLLYTLPAQATNKGISVKDITLKGARPRANGAYISKKNIFLPPDERGKEEAESSGPTIQEDQFVDRYILYGTIKTGNYGVALIKINPKKRRDVPKELREKKIIRLHPGEALEGYTLKQIGDDYALFDKRGRLVRIETFDLDKKPERQTKVSVAQATPNLRPTLPPAAKKLPSTLPAHQSGPDTATLKTPNQLRNKASAPRLKNIGPPPVRKGAKVPSAPTQAVTPSATQSKSDKNALTNNPFLRALKNASGTGVTPGLKTAPNFNPFLKLKQK